jgi:hypothetical protein
MACHALLPFGTAALLPATLQTQVRRASPPVYRTPDGHERAVPTSARRVGTVGCVRLSDER